MSIEVSRFTVRTIVCHFIYAQGLYCIDLILDKQALICNVWVPAKRALIILYNI